MLEFKSPTLQDYDKFAPFFYDEGELSCEMNFISLYVWQKVYENKFYLDDKTLIFKSVMDDECVFSVPYGDLEYGMSLIFSYCKQNSIKPNLWASQGKRLNNLLKIYNCFEVLPDRDSFDYIYNRQDLAELSGKKYHSKRNHISAFSKKYDWRYETLTRENLCDFLSFADKWYADKGEAEDAGLTAEHQALREILTAEPDLKIKGGMIKIGDKTVAATFGSPINYYTFDVHFEKADVDFSTAYSVINREFALRELSEYKYINREDDLGLEGLRKAKLSYKPELLLEKYSLVYKGE